MTCCQGHLWKSKQNLNKQPNEDEGDYFYLVFSFNNLCAICQITFRLKRDGMTEKIFFPRLSFDDWQLYTVKKISAFPVSFRNDLIIPGQAEFGKCHPGRRRENRLFYSEYTTCRNIPRPGNGRD